jgi:hypothetical protein
MVFVIYVLDNLQKQQIALQTPSRNESLSMKAKKGTWMNMGACHQTQSQCCLLAMPQRIHMHPRCIFEDSNADFIRLADKYIEVPSGKNVT